MTITFTPVEEARDELGHALRYHSDGMSDAAREYLRSAHGRLVAQCRVDLTRAGNLSPDYLLAQDRARRESEALSGQHTSAERGA